MKYGHGDEREERTPNPRDGQIEIPSEERKLGYVLIGSRDLGTTSSLQHELTSRSYCSHQCRSTPHEQDAKKHFQSTRKSLEVRHRRKVRRCRKVRRRAVWVT